MSTPAQVQATPSAFQRPNLRIATVVEAWTGERAKRIFTLRDPRKYGTPGIAPASTERTGLLPVRTVNTQPVGRWRGLVTSAKKWPSLFWEWSKSPNAIDIWKCSLAYFLATLVVFIAPATRWFGTSGNQLAANIVVWFSPNRTVGSMQKGVVGALVAFIWAAGLDYTAMGIAYGLGQQDMLTAAHIIIVIFFVGGGFGWIAYVKQTYSDNIINTSCSLASLGVGTLVTVGAIQEGEWNSQLVYHILQMTVLAMLITSLVNVLIRPVLAKRVLRENIAKTTSGFSTMLTAITVSFLTGDEQELKHQFVLDAADSLKKAFDTLDNTLEEAKWEYYLLGTERRYHLGKRLVECIKQLSQDLGGLRSAATTQFALLTEIATQASEEIAFRQHRTSTVLSPTFFAASYQPRDAFPTSSDESSAEESSDDELPPKVRSPKRQSTTRIPSAASAPQIFLIFIEHLGPLMKSLAYTLKQIHDEPPFEATPERPVSYHPAFRSSLADAVELYSKSRKEAIELVYKSKDINRVQSMQVAADFEEVAASCGHFSSSLEDFAEHTLTYLDVLNDLEQTVHIDSRSWTWTWTWFVHDHKVEFVAVDHESTPTLKLQKGTTMQIPSSSTAHGFALLSSKFNEEDFVLGVRRSIWKHLHVFRRDDVKYSIKVGLAGLLLGMFAFIEETKDFYQTWSLQWATLAYMVFCCMTVGASVSTSIQRIIGTVEGGAISLVVWYICFNNPYALAFFGWLVSAGSFYYVIEMNQGPQGRFILLTYNLIILYSYATIQADPSDDSGSAVLWTSLHRVIGILIGCVWGVLVTRFIWPISARKKIRTGLSLLYLRCSLIWRKAPLGVLLDETEQRGPLNPYMDLRDETKLRQYSDSLDTLRVSAESEFKLRGPFPTDSFKSLLGCANSALDALHALNVVIQKDNKASPGEMEILKFTATERDELAGRISHLFSVLAASIQLKYAFPSSSLPSIQTARDRLLAKVYQFRKQHPGVATDEDFELLYCYALVTGQTAKELDDSFKVLDKLYGLPDEDIFKLE